MVEGGLEALDALRLRPRADEPFALVLLDSSMPEMDGFELAERIAPAAGRRGPADRPDDHQGPVGRGRSPSARWASPRTSTKPIRQVRPSGGDRGRPGPVPEAGRGRPARESGAARGSAGPRHPARRRQRRQPKLVGTSAGRKGTGS